MQIVQYADYIFDYAWLNDRIIQVYISSRFLFFIVRQASQLLAVLTDADSDKNTCPGAVTETLGAESYFVL